MIFVAGGIKGGVGKTTLATNMAILLSKNGRDVLLVDADEQASATDFTAVRNEELTLQGGAGYSTVQIHGPAVRTEVLRLTKKFSDIVIDVGGRDEAGQRAALSVADIYAIPFLPGSFDIWTLGQVAALIHQAKPYNEKLQTVTFLNRADARGHDNDEAITIAQETKELRYIDASLGNRKAFRAAASSGLAVTELKPADTKASSEIMHLFDSITNLAKVSK
jgi:chromosome partitioning protein